jgi:hypothetical protein
MIKDSEQMNSKKVTRSSPDSKFKILGKGKLKSNWDGLYVVHSLSPNDMITIMDMKQDQYVVNGQ